MKNPIEVFFQPTIQNIHSSRLNQLGWYKLVVALLPIIFSLVACITLPTPGKAQNQLFQKKVENAPYSHIYPANQGYVLTSFDGIAIADNNLNFYWRRSFGSFASGTQFHPIGTRPTSTGGFLEVTRAPTSNDLGRIKTCMMPSVGFSAIVQRSLLTFAVLFNWYFRHEKNTPSSFDYCYSTCADCLALFFAPFSCRPTQHHHDVRRDFERAFGVGPRQFAAVAVGARDIPIHTRREQQNRSCERAGYDD